MSEKSKIFPLEKSGLHARNRHRLRYNFKELIQCCPELLKFVSLNKYNNESIDFSNPEAVKTLNKALLKHFYHISDWDIPPNYLCPPIPGRADYIHYLADLLSSSNEGVLLKGKLIKILDIGIGANCVYPILGNREYGWSFVGSDIDPIAIKSAKQIILSNSFLIEFIECRLQRSPSAIFRNIIQADEVFDMTMCNPPFHPSLLAAQTGTERKWKNLGIKKENKNSLNFGGRNTELWCEGGEEAFVIKMVEQSAKLPEKCFWFSTLVSQKSSLAGIYKALEKANASEVKTIGMAQGQKVSRIVAWTFLNEVQQKAWRIQRWKS